MRPGIVRAVVVVSCGLVTLGACGADSDEAAVRQTTAATTVDSSTTTSQPQPATSNPDGLLYCDGVDGGVEFSTALESCTKARDAGRQVARSYLPRATDSGLEIVFSAICFFIQDEDGPPSRAPKDDREMAVLLDAGGVCPGDPGMLIPE